MRKFVMLALLGAAIGTGTAAYGETKGREVEYRSGETVLKGYLAEPQKKGKQPAILVVHEWWGHNDYARKRAKMLADLGYVALAVDMFGDGKTAQHPTEAGKFAGEVMKNKKVGEERFNAALEFLRKQPNVDTSKVSAIGYCFGGGVVLHMARQGADLKGVASFHGSLATDTPAKPGMVKARVMVFTGGADQMIPAQQVAGFVDEMSKAGADFGLFSYPGVKHSFTNPDADNYAKKFNMPVAYDHKADERSWKETVRFLEEIFR